MPSMETIDYKKVYGEKKDPERKLTRAWELYQRGVRYNQSLVPDQYNLVDTNMEFFYGNQWVNLPNSSAMAALPKPVFNIIKRITSLFVASLTSSATKVQFEALTNKDGENMQDPSHNAADMATAEVTNIFEKLKMDYRIREALFDGAITGDYCAHFWWDSNAIPYGGAYGPHRGEIAMELVDGINVMFGNPNTHLVQKQPYILLIGRDTVENLQDEYDRNHKNKDKGISVSHDSDTQYQAASGGKVELDPDDKFGKALYIYMYRKKSHEEDILDIDGNTVMEPVTDEHGNPVQEVVDGMPVFNGATGEPVYKMRKARRTVTTVFVSKHTKDVTIFEEVDTGLSLYPIAWGNWERQKNQYHGRALATGIIPNQIYINSMFALVMRHQQLLGFPKTLYDADIIGQWSNTVGQAIAVHNLPPEKRMSDLYSVIQPGDMSTQIMSCIDQAMAYTKECLGATDAQLGNVNPENTSALIALQSSSQVPLENPQANKYEWVEDIGRILLDMMGNYYGQRPVVFTRESTEPMTDEMGNQTIDPMTGQVKYQTKQERVVENFDFRQLKNLWFNIRANVGASTYWSRLASVQTLDNLRNAGILDVIDYLERMPDEYIPEKDALISKIRAKMNMENGTGTEIGAGQNVSSAESVLYSGLDPTTQQKLSTQGTKAKNMILKKAQQTMSGAM